MKSHLKRKKRVKVIRGTQRETEDETQGKRSFSSWSVVETSDLSGDSLFTSLSWQHPPVLSNHLLQLSADRMGAGTCATVPVFSGSSKSGEVTCGIT